MIEAIKLPYGDSYLELRLPNAQVLSSDLDLITPAADGKAIVRNAIANPIGSPHLKDLAKGKRNCVIILSDHTRPVPSKDILPPILDELFKGNPDLEIGFLVATGCHRATHPEEIRKKLGDTLWKKYSVTIHDCDDPDQNVEIGTLPSGTPCYIDRMAVEADLLIAEGFIEPHFFAGFSGGRKSILPGIASRATVLGNHCSHFIDSPFSRTGILKNNPIHNDMLAAAKMAGLSFVVNAVINSNKETLAAFAGDCELAHLAGCNYLIEHTQIKPTLTDIVITTNGGSPLDQNIYQCVKSMTAAEACCRPGGTLIICAKCEDGHGGDAFYQSLKQCSSIDDLYSQFLATPQDQTIPDQWQSQILARILLHYQVIFVTEQKWQPLIEDMKMHYSSSIEEALLKANAYNKTTTVIPNGVSVIVSDY